MFYIMSHVVSLCWRISRSRYVFFCKQKTPCEMRISDWSSDVFSSDLQAPAPRRADRIPGGRGVPADEQGVEPAILAVAGAAGGARATAPADQIGRAS